MALIKDSVSKIFDTSSICKGALCCAKHSSWTQGRAGIITGVTDQELTLQFFPGIGNVSNHFFIRVEEVTAGEWELRWSSDLKQVNEYPKNQTDVKGGDTDAAGEGDTTATGDTPGTGGAGL